jgi:hypothetical protein
MIKASKLRSLYASLVPLSTAASAASAWGSHNAGHQARRAASARASLPLPAVACMPSLDVRDFIECEREFAFAQACPKDT